MPIGHKNASATLMLTINNLFSNMLNFSMVMFLDDILMYLHPVDEHFILLEKSTGVLMSVYILL